MKFAFVTCVQIGLSCMEAIYDLNGKLDLIISIPDEKSKKNQEEFTLMILLPNIKSLL